MRSILFVLYISYCSLVSAQPADTTLKTVTLYSAMSSTLSLTRLSFTSEPFHQVMIGGNGFFNSSFVDVGMAQDITANRFIDASVKDRQLKRMFDKNNKIVFGYDYGAQYTWKKDSSLFTHQISLNERSITYAEIGKDIYRFLMYGNGSAPGTLTFGYNELFDVRFRQLNYGLYYKPMNSLVVFGSVGLLQGLSYHHAFMNSTYFTTSEYGEQLDFNYRLSYAGIDKPVKPWSVHYTGFTLNGGAIFSNNPDRYQAWVAFRDLSSINTRFYTNLYTGVNTVKFEGLEINNLFAITDTTFNQIDTDSLLRFLDIKKVNARVTDALPFSFHLGYKRMFANQYVLQLEAIYYTGALLHYPQLLITSGKRFSDWEISLTGSIGGFRQSHIGCQILYDITSRWCVFFRSTALEGLILPNSRTALQAAAVIGYSF